MNTTTHCFDCMDTGVTGWNFPCTSCGTLSKRLTAQEDAMTTKTCTDCERELTRASRSTIDPTRCFQCSYLNRRNTPTADMQEPNVAQIAVVVNGEIVGRLPASAGVCDSARAVLAAYNTRSGDNAVFEV